MSETRREKHIRLKSLRDARDAALTGRRVKRGRDSDGSEVEYADMNLQDKRNQDAAIKQLEEELGLTTRRSGSARVVW